MYAKMKKTVRLLGLAVVLSSVLLSCSSSSSAEEEEWGKSKMIVNMVADPQPIQLTEEQRTFANDNNQFTLNFLKTVNDVDKSGKSFIYSPLSITYVLAMVNDAATGKTEQELEQTLGFHEGGIKAVNEYCKKLIEGLPKVDTNVQLNIANAIYFKADWASKFDQKNTKTETFASERGNSQLPMMRQKAKIKVNEEGSEAAAVTVAGMNDMMSAGPMESFHANRPFVYVIRESSSGVILFVGKYTGA